MATSGRYRDLIQVQERSGQQGDYGELKHEFNKVFDARVDFKVLSGAEAIRYGAETGTELASVLMRYDRRLKHDHYVLWEGSRYDVQSIKPKQGRNEMVVTLTRQVR